MQENPATSLTSALALYREREQRDLLEGVVLDDLNIPANPANNIAGNVLIIVSDVEFYSVSTDDILTLPNAPIGHPQPVWVTRGKQVWRCQQVSFNAEGQKPVKASELLGKIDNHLFANYPGLVDFATARPIRPPTAAKPQLTKMEKCFLDTCWYYLAFLPSNLDDNINKLIHGADPIYVQLFNTWPECCFGPRPETKVYNRKYDAFIKTTNSTLRHYIAFMGAGHEPTC
jgi:hypothetical protein